MSDFLNKKMIVGVSGGISAYKTAFLVRELKRHGALVRVVMTASAQQFLPPLTMQALSGNEVRCEVFDSQAERAMGHIELARWADAIVIAPASANCIAKLAHGLADDLLSTLCLVTETPLVLSPAMNRSMWAHPATAANVALLKARGVRFVGPEEGDQACGEFGLGRMSETESIMSALRLVDLDPVLRGRRVMITAGPTREAIDPVRYLSNRSSGKMGYALAEAALIAGAEVTLISGPTALPDPFGARCFRVESAVEMCYRVMEALEPGMIFIGAAAVADFTMSSPLITKMKRQGRSTLTLELTANPDVLSTVVASKKAAYTVGFAAETENALQLGAEKLRDKKLDMLIANQVGHNQGFEVDDNQVALLTHGETLELPLQHKMRLAGQIIAIIASKLQN